MSIPHFIITRFGIGIQSQLWFDRKIELMNAVTLSSIKKQTSQAFHWLIVTDKGMPDSCRARFREYINGHDNIHLIDIDPTQILNMEHGGLSWVFDPCREYVLAKGLVEDPTQYVVTSLLDDDDDAWHVQTVGMIEQIFSGKIDALIAGEVRRSSAVRHTSGLVATFREGLSWDISSNCYELIAYPFMSMSVFVLHRFSAGISACTSRHSLWPEYCKVADFQSSIVGLNTPMWIYFRHPGTVRRFKNIGKTPVSDSVLAHFKEQFGIDADKIPSIREDYLNEATRIEQAQHSLEEHYDNQFRITAYNQQINALEKNLRFEKGKENRSSENIGHLEALLRTAYDKHKELKTLYVRNSKQPS